jgi:hypothetical protein
MQNPSCARTPLNHGSMTELTEIGRHDVDWNHKPQDSAQWRAFVNQVIQFPVPYAVENAWLIEQFTTVGKDGSDYLVRGEN